MDKIHKMNCLVAYFAAANSILTDFDPVVLAAYDAGLESVLKEQLLALDAPRLTRRLERGGQKSVSPLDWGTVIVQDGKVRWQGTPIGQLRTFYKAAFPQETQARIAYEVFLDRFLSHVQRTLKVAVLHKSHADVMLFVPAGIVFDLPVVWHTFVDWVFSPEALRKGFILLVNSIKLSGRGIGALEVPIVTKRQAQVLAAFYYARLLSLDRYDADRRNRVSEIDQLLPSSSEQQRKKLETEKRRLLAKIKGFSRYDEARELARELEGTYSHWMQGIRMLASYFNRTGDNQLKSTGNAVTKLMREIKKLAEMQPSDYVGIAPLLQDSPLAYASRGAGDATGQFCYACGQALEQDCPSFEARKFVFESPSQRLQSGSGQTAPKICATCAAISFVSPIKTGTDRLVIRLRHQDDGRRYLLEDQLRMLTMGELNVMAGRYALIQVSERVPKTGGSAPLSERMGGLQYALYKVASLFSGEVFRTHGAEAIIGGVEVPLSGRHLAGAQGLIEVFRLDQCRWWRDKGLFSAVGQAVRYIEKEEVIFAVYELLRAWRKAGLLYQGRLNAVQASRLEQLYETHWRWLMEEKPKEATLFRDVAGMTGMLYAFCSFVRRSVSTDQQRIEVRKLIERATEPYGFIYTAAGNTKREMATLYRQSDTYFCFDQAKNLLAELGVDVSEREGASEKGVPTLVFYFDDVVNAYTYLFENRYRSSKEQRDFTYTLRLSLHARFPELMEREKGE